MSKFYQHSILRVSLLLYISNSIAGGFQIHEQNASLGDVHAGYAVDNTDASVSFYNPAALTDILEAKTTSSAVTVADKIYFKGDASAESFPTSENPPIYQAGKTDTKGLHLIPALHYASPINSRMAFGLSIVSPYAAVVEWSKKAFTRYNVTENGIKTINFSPSLGFRANDYLSLGLGADIQRVEMQIDKIVGSNFLPGAPGESQSSFDSSVTNTLSTTTAGFHAGALLKPNNQLTIGYNYRSRIDHKASGQSKLKGRLAGSLDDLFNDNKINKSKNLKALIKIPQTMAFSVKFQPNYEWSLVSTVIHTNWSIVDYFNLENVPGSFDNPNNNAPVFVKLVKNHLKLKNTFTFLNGVHWQMSDKILLKTGIGYDQTPTNNNYRDLKMPDGDRMLYGIGANYKYNRALNFEFGFMFVKINKTKISNTSIIPVADVPLEPGDVNMNMGEVNKIHGKVHGHAYVAGVQFSMNTAEMWSNTSKMMRRFYK